MKLVQIAIVSGVGAQQVRGRVPRALEDPDLGVLVHPGRARLGELGLELVRGPDRGDRHQPCRGGVEVGEPVQGGEVVAAQRGDWHVVPSGPVSDRWILLLDC